MNKLWSMAAVLVVAIGALVACATIQNWATPDRIQAVAALGAYAGAQAAITDGKLEQVRQADAALHSLQTSGNANLTAVVAAIQAAGVPIGSAEGSLYVQGGVLVFADLWAGTGEKVLDDARAKAAVAGITQGFDEALAPYGSKSVAMLSRAGPGDALARLQAAAIGSRPVKPR